MNGMWSMGGALLAEYLHDEMELGERVAMYLDNEACGFDALFDLQVEAYFEQELPVDDNVQDYWDAYADDEPVTWDLAEPEGYD